MGFLRRLLGGGEQPADRRSAWSLEQRPAWMCDGMEVQLYEGREDLEVVGEASYQDNLWRVVGGGNLPRGPCAGGGVRRLGGRAGQPL
jgi:hypothetical protein